MYVSSRNMFSTTRNLQNRVHMAKSGCFPHLHTSPFFLEWRRCAGQFQWQFFKTLLRVPGQFAMCENLLSYRFQFNSQISIYFDIKQWFLSDIRKMNIILSIPMQTVKNHQRKPQGLAVIFSHHQVFVKRSREDTFFAAQIESRMSASVFASKTI